MENRNIYFKTDNSLVLTSYNIQVAIGSHRLRHMLSHGLRYLMPHGQSEPNLQRIARVIEAADIVALNEADAGSIRTRYVNQAEFLCEAAGYQHCDQMITRDLGKLAQHSNSLLSRFTAVRIIRHRLPRPNDGRGVLEAHYAIDDRQLVVLVTHLSLSQRVRQHQVRYLADIIQQYESVVLMGDMNCSLKAPEMAYLINEVHLHGPRHSPLTYPSWRPSRAIDHILVTENMYISEVKAINEPLSDHLAVTARVGWGGSDCNKVGLEKGLS